LVCAALPDCADIALAPIVLSAPHIRGINAFIALGWPLARIGMLLINVAAVFYIWFRLSRLAQLEGIPGAGCYWFSLQLAGNRTGAGAG